MGQNATRRASPAALSLLKIVVWCNAARRGISDL
jgi:hypothetical protein